MDYQIQNICFSNQENTLYKVTLETSEIYYVVVETDTTELGIYVNEKIALGELIPQQYEVPFSIIKYQKQQQLENDFNISKKITIQNGNTLIIDYNTPERHIFLEKLMIVLQESLVSNVSISYQQKVNNAMYRFSALPTIWNYIFKDLFLVDHKTSNGTLTGFKENSREYNKIVFDAVALKIQNTTTTEELNAISWEFANPNGIFINVNEKAEQILNDPTVDDFTKSAINQSKDPETGQIHLINIVG